MHLHIKHLTRLLWKNNLRARASISIPIERAKAIYKCHLFLYFLLAFFLSAARIRTHPIQLPHGTFLGVTCTVIDLNKVERETERRKTRYTTTKPIKCERHAIISRPENFLQLLHRIYLLIFCLYFSFGWKAIFSKKKIEICQRRLGQTNETIDVEHWIWH